MPSLCITSTSVLAAPEAPQGTIMPIVGYWPIWGLLAVAILLAIFAYYLFVWWNTRKRDPLPELEVPRPAPDLGAIRMAKLREVDAVEARYLQGQLSSRKAHAELSRIIREYVAAATGIPADKMDLTQLRSTGLRGTTHTIAQYYPIVFGAREYRGVSEGARAARSVMTQWL
ncbi:hypothetical protein JRG19_04325 [Pseudoclavibacter alba]|uniref:DUF4129 domain-containing protein n=1 Tax=Pseudoclavibacter albus TaxID=272241 RepID=A0ABT2HWZ0_9MICO|nr:hypothetical protein [Pseudoclavibacter alba]MBN6777777.1 hypothetical protein [Pseudoclavibacter alba]MCT2042823.1 hypothetical protein [Pseudoclavibacter alba]